MPLETTLVRQHVSCVCCSNRECIRSLERCCVNIYSSDGRSTSHFKESKGEVNGYFGNLAQFEAKPGKEAEIEEFLREALLFAQAEPATTAWSDIRLGPVSFGIFDVFPDEPGRQAHLSGRIAQQLMTRAPELLLGPRISKWSMESLQSPSRMCQVRRRVLWRALRLSLIDTHQRPPSMFAAWQGLRSGSVRRSHQLARRLNYVMAPVLPRQRNDSIVKGENSNASLYSSRPHKARQATYSGL